MAAIVEIVVNAVDNYSSVLGNFGSIVTGIESAINLVGKAFEEVTDIIQPFIDSASSSEDALVGLDNVLASTAPGVGIFQETIGQLSNSALLDLTEKLKNAKDKLAEMKDEFPPLKQRTDEQTLAFTVQEEKVKSLTDQLKLGSDGMVVYKDTTQLSRDALIQLAEAMQNTTIYSDEMVLSAETMLLRFENVNSNIFPEAIRLTTDLAAALGIDLTTAAQQVGMALDNPEAGIGRLNTKFRLFDETQMSVIKNMAATGDLAGAQALIMQTLEEKVGGAAEAFGKTFSGQIEIAKNKIDEIREVIGDAFMPVLTDLLMRFNDFASQPQVIQFFTDVAAALSRIIGFSYLSFIDFARTFSELFKNIDASGLADSVLPVLYSVLDFFSSGNIVENITNLAGAFGLAIPLLQFFVSIFEAFVSMSAASLLPSLGLVGFGLGLILDAALPIVAAIAGIIGIMEILHQTTDGLIPSFSQISEKFLNFAESIDWGALSEGIADKINNIDWGRVGIEIRTGLINIFNALGTIVSEINWGALAVAIGSALANLVAGLYGYPDWDALAVDFGAGLEYALVAGFGYVRFEDLARDFKNGFVYIGQQAKLGFAEAFGYDTWLEFSADFKRGLQYTIDSIKNFLGIHSHSTVFSQIGSDIVHGLIDGFSAAWDALMTIAGTALSDFAALFGLDLSSILGTGGSTGSTGGGVENRSPGTGGSGTSNTGGITYNFYGEVNFHNGTGESGDGTYQCLPTSIDIGGLAGGAVGGGPSGR